MLTVFNLYLRIPSASGDRQMLPVQMNRIFTKAEEKFFYNFIRLSSSSTNCLNCLSVSTKLLTVRQA